jgi:hypothetical protein
MKDNCVFLVKKNLLIKRSEKSEKENLLKLNKQMDKKHEKDDKEQGNKEET